MEFLKKALSRVFSKRFFIGIYKTFGKIIDYFLFAFSVLLALLNFYFFLFPTRSEILTRKDSFIYAMIFCVVAIISYIMIKKEQIVNIRYEPKDRKMFVVPLIFSIISSQFLLKSSNLEFSIVSAIALLIVMLGLFVFSIMAGMAIYFIVSQPLIVSTILKFANLMLRFHCYIKKEEADNMGISIRNSLEDLHGNRLQDYLYFCYYLSIICLPMLIISMDIFAKSVEINKVIIYIEPVFWVFVIISPIFFSLHLSHFYWRNKSINPSIFNKFLTPAVIAFVARIFLNFPNRTTLFNTIFLYLFLISGVAFGFLYIVEFSINKIKNYSFGLNQG